MELISNIYFWYPWEGKHSMQAHSRVYITKEQYNRIKDYEFWQKKPRVLDTLLKIVRTWSIVCKLHDNMTPKSLIEVWGINLFIRFLLSQCQFCKILLKFEVGVWEGREFILGSHTSPTLLNVPSCCQVRIKGRKGWIFHRWQFLGGRREPEGAVIAGLDREHGSSSQACRPLSPQTMSPNFQFRSFESTLSVIFYKMFGIWWFQIYKVLNSILITISKKMVVQVVVCSSKFRDF